MIRVTDLERSIRSCGEGVVFHVVSRTEYPKDKVTLVFLQSQQDEPYLELTFNWDTHHYEHGNAYGHVAYEVKSIAVVQERLKKHGYDLSWGPGTRPSGKGKMAFVDDPD